MAYSNDYNDYENSQVAINFDDIIGYSPKQLDFLLIIFPLLGLLSNTYLIYINFSGKKDKKSKSATNTLICLLSILDFLICIYWLLSYINFYDYNDINESQTLCKAFSIAYLFLFTFSLLYLFCVLFHFINLTFNSIESILKPYKVLLKYISIGGAISLIEITLAMLLNQLGQSPMMTCFLKTGDYESSTDINSFLVIIIPLLTIVSSVIFMIYMSIKDLISPKKGMVKIYKIYILYITTYEILNLPLLILLILSSMNSKIPFTDNTMKIFAYITTLITSLIPFIMSIFRACFNLVHVEWLHNCLKKSNKAASLEGAEPTALTISPLIPSNKDEKTDFVQIENKIMKTTIRDILIGIAYSLEMVDKSEELEDSSSKTKHIIKYANIKHIINDININEDNFQEYEFIDYLPKIFKKIRSLYNVDTKDIIESVLPKNNQLSIDGSAGKSGAFFIQTTNNYFIIKSLKSEECKLIRKTFLEKYLDYIEKNPNSLLCPIYGMYGISTKNNDKKFILVMRNLIGSFSNNIMCKYDLKGSTYKRTDEFQFEKVNVQVMKDLDFFNIEKVLMFPDITINSFREIAKNDSAFLNEQELMDYSLLVVKISIDKNMATEIFGNSYNNDREQVFQELMTTQKSKIFLGVDEQTASDKYKHYRSFLYPSLTEGTAYILGIIDYFQYYNFLKLVETKYKNILFNKTHTKDDNAQENETGPVYISCVDPLTYKSRFDLMIDKITKVKELLFEKQE